MCNSSFGSLRDSDHSNLGLGVQTTSVARPSHPQAWGCPSQTTHIPTTISTATHGPESNTFKSLHQNLRRGPEFQLPTLYIPSWVLGGVPDHCFRLHTRRSGALITALLPPPPPHPIPPRAPTATCIPRLPRKAPHPHPHPVLGPGVPGSGPRETLLAQLWRRVRPTLRKNVRE